MPKILPLRKLIIFIYFVVWLGWILLVGNRVQQYFSGTVQVQVANLTVPIHESAELPIYSKFNVTQTFKLKEVVNVDKVVIPIRQPEATKSLLYVSVQNDFGEIAIQEFEMKPEVKELEFPLAFEKPSNNLAVFLSASEVSWKVKDTDAPRIYREKSIRGYRDGKMAIAGIEKEGNIGLSAFATYSRVDYMKKQFTENHKIASIWLKDGLIVFIILIWPVLFLDFLFVKKQQENYE